VHRRDRLARASAAAHEHGPVPGALDQLALRGVEKDAPEFQRFVHHPAKLVVVFDEPERPPAFVRLQSRCEILDADGRSLAAPPRIARLRRFSNWPAQAPAID